MESVKSMAPRPGWRVVCLCADWCGTCREWQSTFEAAAGTHPQWRFSWVDIEDEADALGEVDIETFPTLLVAQDDRVLFFGPVLPLPDHLPRLLDSLAGGTPAGGTPAEAQGLLARLRAAGLC